MKKILLSTLFLILLISCNPKTQNYIDDIWDDFSFNSTLSNTTQIIIKAYDSSVTNKTREVELYDAIKEYKISTKQQVKLFETIFENSEKTGYCCCPKSSYSIHFFKHKKEIDFFYVDTLELKNNVRITKRVINIHTLLKNKNGKIT